MNNGNTSSAGSCAACPPGSYAPSASSSCTSCPAGSYCPGGSSISGCPSGTTSNGGAGSSGNCYSTCPGGAISDTSGIGASVPNNVSCKCPNSSPYWDGSNCVGSCPSNTPYDIFKVCYSCYQGVGVNSGQVSKQIVPNTYNLCACPITAPVWNLQTNVCQPCPLGVPTYCSNDSMSGCFLCPLKYPLSTSMCNTIGGSINIQSCYLPGVSICSGHYGNALHNSCVCYVAPGTNASNCANSF